MQKTLLQTCPLKGEAYASLQVQTISQGKENLPKRTSREWQRSGVAVLVNRKIVVMVQLGGVGAANT
jgi:hypothetical protein